MEIEGTETGWGVESCLGKKTIKRIVSISGTKEWFVNNNLHSSSLLLFFHTVRKNK